MIDPAKDKSLRTAALISGYGILIMAIVYMLADSLVFQKLIIMENAAKKRQTIFYPMSYYFVQEYVLS